MDVETQGLRELIADLDKVGTKVFKVGAVVERGAVNIKRDWQQRWTGMAHAPSLPAAISYDPLHWSIGRVETEIGPDKARRQGALGNLVEFGSVHNGPRPGGVPALDAEAPKFERAILDLGVRMVEP